MNSSDGHRSPLDPRSLRSSSPACDGPRSRRPGYVTQASSSPIGGTFDRHAQVPPRTIKQDEQDIKARMARMRMLPAGGTRASPIDERQTGPKRRMTKHAAALASSSPSPMPGSLRGSTGSPTSRQSKYLYQRKASTRSMLELSQHFQTQSSAHRSRSSSPVPPFQLIPPKRRDSALVRSKSMVSLGSRAQSKATSPTLPVAPVPPSTFHRRLTRTQEPNGSNSRKPKKVWSSFRSIKALWRQTVHVGAGSSPDATSTYQPRSTRRSQHQPTLSSNPLRDNGSRPPPRPPRGSSSLFDNPRPPAVTSSPSQTHGAIRPARSSSFAALDRLAPPTKSPDCTTDAVSKRRSMFRRTQSFTNIAQRFKHPSRRQDGAHIAQERSRPLEPIPATPSSSGSIEDQLDGSPGMSASDRLIASDLVRLPSLKIISASPSNSSTLISPRSFRRAMRSSYHEPSLRTSRSDSQLYTGQEGIPAFRGSAAVSELDGSPDSDFLDQVYDIYSGESAEEEVSKLSDASVDVSMGTAGTCVSQHAVIAKTVPVTASGAFARARLRLSRSYGNLKGLKDTRDSIAMRRNLPRTIQSPSRISNAVDSQAPYAHSRILDDMIGAYGGKRSQESEALSDNAMEEVLLGCTYPPVIEAVALTPKSARTRSHSAVEDAEVASHSGKRAKRHGTLLMPVVPLP
ncbi:hypothetical protein E5Q_05322 [Mixia osmundae IAM 14324]|uniref:Uncharacterized protein n=1 Tax=Mixia osmundae (strain CBS 9802 / IAM 14324 / JCM 22182 / KY 12970) TaxID=764103 RepID=G7E725_MIXOS|nr:hypothetical protein E5Q_05322 [Mixia osmundae IAM 14324]